MQYGRILGGSLGTSTSADTSLSSCLSRLSVSENPSVSRRMSPTPLLEKGLISVWKLLFCVVELVARDYMNSFSILLIRTLVCTWYIYYRVRQLYVA